MLFMAKRKIKTEVNNNQKTTFIIIGAVAGVFLIYSLFLSPYAQCVSGYKKLKTGYEQNVNARAKIHCKALGK